MTFKDVKIKPILDTLRLEDISDEVYFSEKYADYVSNSRLSYINPDQDGSPEKYFYENLDDNGMIGAMNAIKEMTTIEAITLEDFKEKTEQLIEEFVGDDKSTDTEVVAHAMLIGLALGKLGLMLFGGEDNASD